MSDFTFTYEDKRYEFNLDDITFEHSITIQKEVGITLGDFINCMYNPTGDPRALQALLWLGKQIANEACRFTDLNDMRPFKLRIINEKSATKQAPAKQTSVTSVDPTSRSGRTRKPRTTATL